MNKKLLALAIGAAVAMPVAALADGPTLYGKINVSLESVEDNLGTDPDIGYWGNTDEAWVVRSNASRIGVKGSVETGVEGVKGLYKAEFLVDADNGDTMDWCGIPGCTPFDQRDIYVGLTGGFGTVLLGQLDSPTKSVQGKVDQFNDTTVDMGNWVAGELRAPNVVAYASPKLADAVTVTVALWQAEGMNVADGQPGDSIGDAVSASVVYEKDSLYLGLGLDQETPAMNSVDGLNWNDIVRLVAGYTTDTFEVGGMYQTADEADGGDEADTTMLLSGAYKTGDWKFKGQYAVTEGDLSGDEVTMMGVGADYALGKATTAYAFYASEEYDNGSAADDRTVLSLGLEQRF